MLFERCLNSLANGLFEEFVLQQNTSIANLMRYLQLETLQKKKTEAPKVAVWFVQFLVYVQCSFFFLLRHFRFIFIFCSRKSEQIFKPNTALRLRFLCKPSLPAGRIAKNACSKWLNGLIDMHVVFFCFCFFVLGSFEGQINGKTIKIAKRFYVNFMTAKCLRKTLQKEKKITNKFGVKY